MGEEEYIDKMLVLLRDPTSVHRAMLRDIYQNGQVLQHKKYKYLGAAYRSGNQVGGHQGEPGGDRSVGEAPWRYQPTHPATSARQY